MEAAVARGQGKSATGAVLENMTFEVIMPPSIAMIIDAETDNKNRTMMEVKMLIKTHGGTVSPINYLFQRKGRITFEKDERNLGVNDVMDDAIEAGAEDIELDENGDLLVWTEPNKTTAAATALQQSLSIKVRSSDIIWDANGDTKVPIELESDAKNLSAFIEALRDNPNVQGIYANPAQGNLSGDAWADLQSQFDA
jgi:transcriptional/translational regulatory protein YebC/TACO1